MFTEFYKYLSISEQKIQKWNRWPFSASLVLMQAYIDFKIVHNGKISFLYDQ